MDSKAAKKLNIHVISRRLAPRLQHSEPIMRVIIICLMLSACTTSNTLKPVLGEESYTPFGWVQYCNDNPSEC